MLDSKKEQELNGLFGSQSEDEDVREDNEDGSEGGIEDDEMDVEPGLFSSDDDENGVDAGRDGEGDDDQAEGAEEAVVDDISLPCVPDPFASKAEVFITKWPPILTAEPKPFNADQYEAAKTRNEAYKNVEGTLRWWYKREPDGTVSEHEKESNARFVRWSDGSLSLQIGSEIVMVQQHSIRGYHYIAVKHNTRNNMQVRGAVKRQMALVPLPKSDMENSSRFHSYASPAVSPPRSRFGAGVKSSVPAGKSSTPRRSKSSTTKLVIVDVDPEKQRLEAERAEREKMRLRKRLAAKKRNEKEKIVLSEAFLEADEGSDVPNRRSFTERYHQPNFDEYEKDDFVVSDEEEEEDVDVANTSDSSNNAGESTENFDDEDGEDSKANRILMAKQGNV